MENNKYIFTSKRLGFRNWKSEDLEKMAKINADPEVMRFFPSTNITEQTQNYCNQNISIYVIIVC